MKAIEIIEAMCFDPTLAECAQVSHFDSELQNPKDWCRDMFDAHVVTSDYGDKLTTGNYLTVWSCDFEKIYPFINNQPDFILERYCPQDYDEDDRLINLWRIE